MSHCPINRTKGQSGQNNMKIESNMKNILDINVSSFANISDTIPSSSVNLYEWMVSKENKTLVDKIRKENDFERRKKLKKQLPCITPSGLFKKRRADGLIKHSGFICIDIDKKDNSIVENFSEMKKLIQGLDCVAYCSLSASGEGFFVLIPLSNPEKHKQHFESLKLDFSACGITIDTSCSDISRLRFASYDEAPYINVNAKPYNKIIPTKLLTVKPINAITNNRKRRSDVEKLLDDIELLEIDITTEYKDWFAIGCSIASEFGEYGRKYFHKVSQFYHGYNINEADRQYTACMSDKNEHSIGTLFWYAQQYGLLIKNKPD